MCGNKRPLISRRELQALVASRDAFLGNCSAVENDVAEPTGFTPLSLPHASQMPTFTNPGQTIGQLSLPVNNFVAVIRKANRRVLVADDDMNFGAVSIQTGIDVNEKGDIKALRAAWARHQAKQVNLVPDHCHHTRRAADHREASHLQQQQLGDFNAGFRALPAEVRDMIFCFAIEWDGKKTPRLIVGLRTTWNDPNQQLYKAALRAFHSRYTFVLTRKNSYTMDPRRDDAMLPVVWDTIRNLEIRHEYMGPNHRGDPFLFVHHTPDGTIPCPFSPCTRCDFRTISLAKMVRKLHLDFGDSCHCIMDSIEGICRLAIEEMHHLERLVLTLSNLRCIHSDGYVTFLINKINEATKETGRLLSVGSKAFSNSPDHEDFASESWFWQTTEPRSHLCWVDNWVKKIAEDEAAAEALFGKRRLTAASATAASATAAPATTATPATTALAINAPATTAPVSTTPIINADANDDGSSKLDFDDEPDFDDSDPEEEYFDYFMLAPQ